MASERRRRRHRQNRALKIENQRSIGASNGDDEEDEEGSSLGEEEEMEELEREVKEMGQRILESRRAMPNRIAAVLSSRLAASRPAISAAHPAAPAATAGDRTTEAQAQFEPNHEKSFADADHGMQEKLATFRAKTARNIGAMPIILKRMNDCISRIDKLNQFDVNIHDVFKRKRTY